jgi:hypothetical protein
MTDGGVMNTQFVMSDIVEATVMKDDIDALER